MLEFCALGIAGLYGYYRCANHKEINNKKYLKDFKKEINNKWNMCMKYSNIKNYNDDTFAILDFIPKEYGCDCIISIPIGLSAKKIFDNMNMIENNFGCKVYINISKAGNSIYARFVIDKSKVSELDEIRCKWNKLMLSDNKLYNQDLETFKLSKIIKQEKYGYDITLSIPTGKSIFNIESIKEIIETNFKCKLYFDKPLNNKCLCKFITKEFSDNYKFVPVKVTPTQLFLGMTYDYRNIIVDLKDLAHMLYTGMNGTGKTVCLLTALTNLIYWQDKSKWELYISMISSKKDLRIFKDVKQCRYYAETLENSLLVLKHLLKEMNRRNKLFNDDTENCIVNVYEWNEKHPNKKLRDIIFACDESSYYMADNMDNEADTKIKNTCVDVLLRLYKEGRSTGIHLLSSQQRPDKESLNPRLKAQIGIKVIFYQPNIPSSLVVIGTEEATKIRKTREAIVEADEKYLMKTLYLSPDMIKKYISKSVEKNHKYISLNDNIQELQDNKQNIQKNTDNLVKISENIKKKAKKSNKNNSNMHSSPAFKPKTSIQMNKINSNK